MAIISLPKSNPKQPKERNIWIQHNGPPKVAELVELQDMLYDLVVGVKFKNFSNEFQTKLRRDIKNIARENKVFVAADKTHNFNKVSKENHNELLEKEINKEYRKTDENAVKDITKKDKEIARNLGLDNRIYKTAKRQAFITLKDHKPNFQNVEKCRLLNPTKSEVGKISKKIL